MYRVDRRALALVLLPSAVFLLAALSAGKGDPLAPPRPSTLHPAPEHAGPGPRAAGVSACVRRLRVGQTREQVEALLPTFGCSARVHGPGFRVVSYWLAGAGPDPRLRVGYYPDGEAYAVEFDGQDLGSDDPVTWPRTVNDRSRRLRRPPGGP